jgi:hypothetical protein
MRRVTAKVEIQASVHEAETLWYDTGRWAEWVDGLDRVDSVGDDWPDRGAVVVWRSNPRGRGRVSERVTGREPLRGQESEVEDDSIRGTQEITFTPDGDRHVTLTLTLAYEIKRRSLLMPVMDVLFIRGAMVRSLQTTLTRFATKLEATT